MGLENVKYDAFISYRHSELDKFVAENLHKQLEAFKVPKELTGSGKTNGKTKIERVFRDRDELPLASNLADPITMALEQSDYLIVICSPRLPESKWCLKEIETFIALHGREHILAVLIEGEPVDSFPEILRFEDRILTKEDGTTYTERIEVEPLAADVRGKDKKEVLKQIKSELLRLVAPILECNYDDLKMRHKEAHQKKVLRISLSISLVCFIFATVSTTMALTIHKQSGTIAKQYNEALITQAKSYASTSKTLLEEEDPLAAIAVSRLALPDSLSSQTSKPYTADAEYALNDSLGVYNNGQFSMPVRALEQNSPINLMLVSPEEDTITSVDINSQITIYDVATGSTLVSYSLPEEYSISLDEHSIAYFTNDKLLYIASGGYCIYDIKTQKETFYPAKDSYSYVSAISDGSYFALSGYDGLDIYDSNGNICYHYTWPEGILCNSSMTFYKSKQLFAFSSSNNVGEESKGCVSLVDLNTMKLIYTVDTDITQFAQLSFLDEQLLCAGRTILQNSDNPLDVTINSTICSFPLDTNKANWSYTKENAYLNEFTGSPDWDKPIIAFSTNDGVEFINASNGKPFNYYSTGSKPVGMIPLKTAGNLYLVTENGDKIIASYDTLIGMTTIEMYDTSNGNFQNYMFGYNVDAGFRRNGTSITLYQKTESEESTLLTTLENNVNMATFSAKQDKMLVFDTGKQVFLYSMDDATCTKLTTLDNYEPLLFFTGDNEETCGIVTKDSILLFDSESGEQIKTISLADVFATLDKEHSASTFDALRISEDNNNIALYENSSDKAFLYDIAKDTATFVDVKESTSKSENIVFDETLTHYGILSTTNNTISIYQTASGELEGTTDINASLVTAMFISDTDDFLMVTYLDNTVALYKRSDLTLLKTYTDFNYSLSKLEKISIKQAKNDSSVPVYALYGTMDCQLLNADLEPVGHAYSYITFDSNNQRFILSKSKDILAVPYQSYDTLIKKADNLLKDYQLSNQRMNQLGILLTH